jgi:hypothetical protein
MRAIVREKEPGRQSCEGIYPQPPLGGTLLQDPRSLGLGGCVRIYVTFGKVTQEPERVLATLSYCKYTCSLIIILGLRTKGKTEIRNTQTAF